MRMNCDLEVCQNNGTIAIRPTSSGKLRRLVRQNRGGDEKVWIFKTTHVWDDEGGFERFDHATRGVVCGGINEAKEFVGLCRSLGLKVEYPMFYVPCSNGKQRYGHFRDKEPCADYAESELRMVRVDLPSKEQMSEMIKNQD